MPKYYDFKVAGYYLYFTSFCVVECMHVHASDAKFTEGGSAKFFVRYQRFLISSKTTIRKCISAGRNIVTKVFTKSRVIPPRSLAFAPAPRSRHPRS